MQIVAKAKDTLERYQNKYQGLMKPVPDELLPPQGTLGFRVQLYGMTRWGDLFTSRQALALTRLTAMVKEAGINLSSEYDNNFAKAVQTCLGLAINRMIDRTSSLCTWRPQADQEKVEHVFSRQTLSMTWDFAEGNLLSSGTAGWDDAYEAPAMLMETLGAINLPSGTSIQASATTHRLSNDAANAFITDPPYYGAVPYADLSDFFYVWLKRSIGHLYPDLFVSDLAPKDDECVVDEVKGHDKAYFEQMMGKAMAEGYRVLAPDGICTVVFAHKSTSGWEAQLQSMIDAGWTITGSWPIDTEMGSRLRAVDSAALASSIHLVCRPRKNPDGSARTNDIGDWRDVLQELPRRIHEWMPRLAAEGIVGADAIFSCLGPALEIFSQYSRVERADGEQVTLKEYLEYVWAAVSREALHTIFQGADTSGFEPDSRLTAIWLWTLLAGAENNGNGKKAKPANGASPSSEEGETEETEDEEEEATNGSRPGLNGYAMEFDTARKLAQGLGVHLDKMQTLVELKGSVARLRSVRERTRFLFQKGVDDLAIPKPQKKARTYQQTLFSLPEQTEEAREEREAGDLPAFTLGVTILDRLHQAMLLYASGRTDALRYFLKEEGAGTDPRFWKLALALSSLYPRHSDEKRWVDGVQGQKRSLGL
jgi:putative DNA methylase